MKRSELQEIIRRVVKESINELMGSSSDEAEMDLTATHVDDMSPAEKAKHERDLEQQRRDNIKSTDMELKIAKKQSDYFNQQVQKNKLDITSNEKELSRLKGAI
jgi:hypothetical protein